MKENESSKGGNSKTELVVNQSWLTLTARRAAKKIPETELDVRLRPSNRGSYEGLTAALLAQTRPTILAPL